MIRSQGPIIENACHEGNYGLKFILSIARWEERQAGGSRGRAIRNWELGIRDQEFEYTPEPAVHLPNRWRQP
jgi:hypothetical protein